MSSYENDGSVGRSLSLPAMLSVLTGAGTLFVYWRLDYLFANLGDGNRLLILWGATGLLVVGLIRLFADLPVGSGRALSFARQRVYLPRPGQAYLVIMIVVFSGSLLGRSNMLMLVFSMMAGPFVVNGWITYSMLKRTSVSRLAPPRVMAGEPMTVELVLSNRKRLMSCWLMSARDTIQNAEEILDPGVLFARVPAGGKRSGHYHARLVRRGRYRFGPIQLTARFPLGIVERGLALDTKGEILVYPRLGRLSSRWIREHFLATDPVERRELRQGVFDDEFHRIREFRWGDNPRDIHWRTSARHNALMVREYRQSRDLDLTVLVDFWLPEHAANSARERVELAASVAATICVTHMKQSRDSSLNIAIAGKQLAHWEGESRLANADPLMDEFALAEGAAHPDVGRLLEKAAGRYGHRTVLVTTRAAGSPERRELERIVSEERVADRITSVELIESDYAGLSAIFEFV